MKLSTLFFIVLILEILGSITHNRILVLVTKPLLMPLLMVMAYKSDVKDKLLFLALLFSLFGDIFLMFEGSNFFIFGLSSFLVAHLCYIFLFKPQTSFNFISWVGFGVFVAVFLVFILPSLPEALRIPVVLYSLVIASMGAMAASRKNVDTISYKMILVGAILFIVSDAMIAINAFHTPIPKSALYIMSTYGLAQLLIVKGWIKQKDFL